jgi:hypothetical protein
MTKTTWVGLRVAVSLASALGCSDAPPIRPATGTALGSAGAEGTPAGGSCDELRALVGEYETGTRTLAALTESARMLADRLPPPALSETVEGCLLVPAGEHVVATGMVVPSGGLLVLAPGARLSLAASVSIDVAGALYALGTAEDRVAFTGADVDRPYSTIALHGARSELHHADLRYGNVLLSVTDTAATSVRVTGSRFDSWVGGSELGLDVSHADGFVLEESEIGVNTPETELHGEGMHAVASSVVVRANVFGRRSGYKDAIDLGNCSAERPVLVIGNEFLGGDDDAIDLDDCAGIVAGNYLHDFVGTPEGKANGGCVTGGGASELLVVNNVLENCHHGIGFKEGTSAVLFNNTIVDSDEGLRLAVGAQLTAVGNVLWRNGVDATGDARAVLSAEDNLFEIEGFTGMNGNRALDPEFVDEDGVPYSLGPNSPARGATYATPAKLAELLPDSYPFAPEVVRAHLELDFLGRRRPLPALDRGAIQGKR